MSATWRIIEGDCRAVMHSLMAESVDAVVCDPPYGLEFMGKEWDRLSGQPGYVERGRITDRPDAQVPYGRGGGVNSYQAGRPMQEWHEGWAVEALRVLKPGGHLVAFGGPRTYHRLACGIEDAGFEIRDKLSWLFGSGFPKSKNLGDGWGTALKPGHEPICLARKPFRGSATANHAEHGTGGLNVDGCRIEGGERPLRTNEISASGLTGTGGASTYGSFAVRGSKAVGQTLEGRWPANVVMDEDAAAELDAQTEDLRQGFSVGRNRDGGAHSGNAIYGARNADTRDVGYGDSGGASRFYYCAKASTAERGGGNTHPTVKPIDLMRWLCRLVTPKGGTILDPFTGSGTTGIAALREGLSFIGIEREAEYVRIARDRIIGDSPMLNTAAEMAA